MKLLLNGMIKFICGLLLCGLLIFLPAGTLNYFGGWLFMGAVFIPILLMGILLYCKAPDLLAKRLNFKEKEQTQKGVALGAVVLFLVLFIMWH